MVINENLYLYKDNELKIASVCKQNKPDMVEHIVVAESLEKAIELLKK